jgi:large subunit ribosomal protein L17
MEPLITKGKENTTHQRRVVFGYLQDKVAVTELFSTIAEKIGGRPEVIPASSNWERV